MKRNKKSNPAVQQKPPVNNRYHFEFKHPDQKLAWAAFEQHDVIFVTGSAGTGKSFLSVAYAINEVLNRRKRKIVLTRPIVESGEHLGFLPGDFNEKINPYMLPLYDSIKKLVGDTGMRKEVIGTSVEVAPLAYLRGRTFSDAICILDEAQNATMTQLKLFLTRFDSNSKMIINGDPKQSDIRYHNTLPLVDAMNRLQKVKGIAFVNFGADAIVRHPLIKQILESLES